MTKNSSRGITEPASPKHTRTGTLVRITRSWCLSYSPKSVPMNGNDARRIGVVLVMDKGQAMTDEKFLAQYYDIRARQEIGVRRASKTLLLKLFAKIRADERERCAKICDVFADIAEKQLQVLVADDAEALLTNEQGYQSEVIADAIRELS